MIPEDIVIPKELKKEFRKIWGKLYNSPEEIEFPPSKKIISVGDLSSYNLIKAGIKPKIIVFDGRIERKKADKRIVEILKKYGKREYRVKNPRKTITVKLWKTVKKVLKVKSKVRVFVDGEEDLAAFPFILEVEKNSIVVYGFRRKGIVAIEVNERVKKKAERLLQAILQRSS